MSYDNMYCVATRHLFMPVPLSCHTSVNFSVSEKNAGIKINEEDRGRI